MTLMTTPLNPAVYRVLMTLLAIIPPLAVTPGAVSRVPISGVTRPVLTGQARCPLHVSTGAAQSEPHSTLHGTLGTPSAVRGPGGARGVPGVSGGARGDPRCAHHTGVDECIYGGAVRARRG